MELLNYKIIEFANMVDTTTSFLGSDIKAGCNDILEYIKGNSNKLTGVEEEFCWISRQGDSIIVKTDIFSIFYNKYCIGSKAIKDNIYYNINFRINGYKYFTISRDIVKSPRKMKEVPNKIYKTTYNGDKSLSKDPEYIANYYSKKYSISNKENIVATMTEDDVLCLNCGCVSDERLSDVPDRDIHLRNMRCPKCNSISSPLVTFNKRLCKLSTFYRDSE